MNLMDWGVKYFKDHYDSREGTPMNEYVVTITPRGEPGPIVGCVVSSRHDPRSAWGRYSLFSQMAQDAGQITVHIGRSGEKITVADAGPYRRIPTDASDDIA